MGNMTPACPPYPVTEDLSTNKLVPYAARAALLREARYPAKPRPAKPRSIIAQVEGSGTTSKLYPRPARNR
jgi:hypothetical protein